MKSKELMHTNETHTAIVEYHMWDLGMKYKVYTIRDGVKRYYQSFESITQAVKCCDMIP